MVTTSPTRSHKWRLLHCQVGRRDFKRFIDETVCLRKHPPSHLLPPKSTHTKMIFCICNLMDPTVYGKHRKPHPSSSISQPHTTHNVCCVRAFRTGPMQQDWLITLRKKERKTIGSHLTGFGFLFRKGWAQWSHYYTKDPEEKVVFSV